MQVWKVLGIVVVLATGGCAGSSATAPTSQTLAMNGTWNGIASDSTGSMMGAGLTSSMMANTTWAVAQTGSTFSGTMRFGGYMGGAANVSGTMNGHSGTFTMTMTAGSMMSGTCTATASGAFDMDDLMTQWHGTYGGTNSCTGPFDHGQMSMHR